jgi:hypothetical protein
MDSINEVRWLSEKGSQMKTGLQTCAEKQQD